MKTFSINKNEFWFGPAVNDGIVYPLDETSDYFFTTDDNGTLNQVNPVLLSNQGRVIFCPDGLYDLSFKDGIISINCENAEINTFGTTLKDAFLGASKKYFPPSGKVPPKEFFSVPQYNTWIELLYNQTQDGILEYAENILSHDMPAGIIMIDDGWSDYYGKWDFNGTKFKEPKKMVEKLHSMGFKVMLWTCPFITPDTLEFRTLLKKGYLLKGSDGKVAIREWWNGYSAVLDLTNPMAVEWYLEQNQKLIDNYGIDGFKLDAGDYKFYREDDCTYAKTTPLDHCRLWGEVGLNYDYNEYRACYKLAGEALVQRLCDKNHEWNNNGVSALVPNQLTQGILGYAFTCPDMIGGGEYLSFLDNSDNLDQELFVRYSQCAALMPMIQFSAAPWRVLDKKHFELCKKSADIHTQFGSYIFKLAKESAKTGEPIVRLMEYDFPSQGMEKVTDQFMLGEYLIAPVFTKSMTERTVHFPEGTWLNIENGEKINGGISKDISSPLDTLLVFQKI